MCSCRHSFAGVLCLLGAVTTAAPAKLLADLIKRRTRPSAHVPDGPTGSSPTHTDRSDDPHPDFDRVATGSWHRRLRIRAVNVDHIIRVYRQLRLAQGVQIVLQGSVLSPNADRLQIG